MIGAVAIEENYKQPEEGKEPEEIVDDGLTVWLNIMEHPKCPAWKTIVFQKNFEDEVDEALDSTLISYHFIGNHLVWFTDIYDGIKCIKLFENRDQTLKATTQA
jgi:hypothetical protein